MKKLFISLFPFVFTANAFAQSLAINSDGSAANNTAMLDVKSTSKGFLPPRMTQLQRDAIAAPAAGLIVQCTDCSTIGPYTYNGSTWVSMSYKTYKIGDVAQGGIVFWIDDSGQHGLVAAPADLGPGSAWYNLANIFCNKIRNDGIYIGSINTDAILAAQGAPGSYAAQLCAIYLGGGYGDWYLPSKYELNLLYQQKALVGGFVSLFYWSSTEIDASNAWMQYFVDGSQISSSKSSSFSVRAIRKF